ncbi:MAG: 30S ribosomal protein S4 [Ignavibacteria bacterium]|nr:30S ribosomal protein S4 [Ignavibacteria bacterium]
MARYTDPSCRLCRRERQKLFLKGTKCFTEKCPVERRGFPPGQHGQSRRTKISEYGVQLREKQKVRRTYGLMERQFRNYFERARKQTGRTGEALVKLLERRFDNVIYRMGLAPSRKAARQMITHGHFLVNSRNVDIPSYLLKAGDVVQVRDRSKKLDVIHSSMKRMKDTTMLPWLSLDKATMSGTFLTVPERADVPLNADEQLIVELYSK